MICFIRFVMDSSAGQLAIFTCAIPLTPYPDETKP